MKSRWGLIAARIVALAFVIGISLYIYSIRDQAEKLTTYGYPGIFLISLLAYSTIILPAPAIAIVFSMGNVFPPLGIALAAGVGAALGEVVGYIAGYGGRGVVEKVAFYDTVVGWMQKYGNITILLLSALPNPLFDVVGAAAGTLKVPVLKFLFWCWIGETIKMIIFAYGGYWILGYFA